LSDDQTARQDKRGADAMTIYSLALFAHLLGVLGLCVGMGL
jgi:hypothetical protein